MMIAMAILIRPQTIRGEGGKEKVVTGRVDAGMMIS